jgi:hypothetical protein
MSITTAEAIKVAGELYRELLMSGMLKGPALSDLNRLLEIENEIASGDRLPAFAQWIDSCEETDEFEE